MLQNFLLPLDSRLLPKFQKLSEHSQQTGGYICIPQTQMWLHRWTIPYKLQSTWADYSWSHCDFSDPSCLRDFVFYALPDVLSNTCFMLMSTKLSQIDEPQQSPVFPSLCLHCVLSPFGSMCVVSSEAFQDQNENESTKICETSWFLGEKNPHIVVSFSDVWSTVSATNVCKGFHLQQDRFGACKGVSTLCKSIWQEQEWKMH